MNLGIRAPLLSTIAHDGDTLEHTLTVHFATRLLGVDTPELSDPAQHAAAVVVRDAVQAWIERHVLLFDPATMSFDKFGSRVDQEIWGVDAEGRAERLSEFLLNRKFAHRYSGGRKTPWTDVELAFIELQGASV